MEREITIRVPAFDSFVTEYSSNVSTTGMFIQSEKPLPPDTKLSFEFKVADDWKLIRGKATVIWSRYRDEGVDRPAGMGVLFTELDPQSRRLIQWIIEKHVRDGGTPFDLGELKETYEQEQLGPGDTDEPEAPPAVTRVMTPPKLQSERPTRSARTIEPTPSQRDRPLPFRLGPLVLAGIVVASVLGALFWLSERGAQSAANPDLPQAETPGEEEAAVAPDEPAASGPASEQAPEVDDGAASGEPPQAVATTSSPAQPAFGASADELVRSWAQAWSSQDPDRYLSFYASDFRPANGQSRSAWAAGRRDRLTAPDFIQVSVSAFEAELLGDSRGRVTFDQIYRSNTFEDEMRKALVLVREDGRWKIAEEAAAE